MGLDMYLDISRSVYESMDEDFDALKAFVDSKMVGSPLPECTASFGGVYTIGRRVAYWRKANAIHSWFVTNTQEGRDECQTTAVDEEDLQDLVDICSDVLGELHQYYAEAHAADDWERDVDVPDEVIERVQEMLTPRAGFFFGSTDIDLWYYHQVKYTHDRLTELLEWLRKEASQKRFWEVTYRSSW